MTITMSFAHSSTLPLLHLRHSSFSNPSIALPTSQLILQPFRCFNYVKAHSPTLLSLLLRHRVFTYVTWRAAHGTVLNVKKLKQAFNDDKTVCCGQCVFILNNYYINSTCSTVTKHLRPPVPILKKLHF